jgi:peptidyl-prolyl cis-trans isomerase C
MAFPLARQAVLSAVVAAALSAAAHAQETPSADTVVATVNGQPVTLGEVIAVRGDLPAQYQQLPDHPLYDGIREQLISQRLLAEAAEAAGVANDPEAARALKIQREGLLAQYYMESQIAARLTDERVTALYDERIGQAEPVEEIRASHILVAEEAKAADLRAQIEGGADFAALAAEHGTDGTKAQGGDLGWFTREVMVPEFATAAFALEVGQVSQPVQTQFGWHLIKLAERRQQEKPTLDAVRGEIEGELSSQIAQELLTELREAATVSVDEARPGVEAFRDDTLIAR